MGSTTSTTKEDAAPTATSAAASGRGAADVAATMRAINDACRSRGDAHAGYSCKTVSWDDASRGTVGGNLSCWGSNITDTYLKAKDGARLFTVRSDNWNEKLGVVSTSDVALVAGNHVAGGGPLKPITLRDYLRQAGKHGAYAGLAPGCDLSADALDQKCSIRFQTTFLPVADADQAAMEFATEAYNYNTRSDADPKNLVLLATTQGVALQQDGAGAKRLYHHAVDRAGQPRQYWLEAERSKHSVGGAQKESSAERDDALRRGKATASVIGVKAMGTRFNVLMTVQLPLQQKPRQERFRCIGSQPVSTLQFAELKGLSMDISDAISDSSVSDLSDLFLELNGSIEDSCDLIQQCSAPCSLSSASAPMSAGFGLFSRRNRAAAATRAKPKRGRANAARVSRGSELGRWGGLRVKAPKRHPAEHITVTVVIYNTVAGGVPSPEDVAAAIDDMEALYAACAASASGRLAEQPFNFMKKALTVGDAADIKAKIQTQPYTPPVAPVVNAAAFPTDAAA